MKRCFDSGWRLDGRRGSAQLIALVLALVLGGGAVAAFLLWPTPQPFPPVPLSLAVQSGTDDDPCTGKKTCLLVYLAPWCGYCQKSVPQIQELAKRWQGAPDKGVRVVVGMADSESCEGMAAALGTPVHISLDPDRALASPLKDMGYSGVPHWFLLDEQGRIDDAVAGFAPMADVLDALGVDP